MFKKRTGSFAILAAAAAMVAGPLTTPASGDVLFVSDVKASIAVPATAPTADGRFNALGTITNSGNSAQPSGSTLTFSESNGSVTSAPAGCSLSAGKAVCSVGALSPGQAVTVSVGVTPAPGATSVVSTVVVKAAQLESDLLDQTNNTASATTGIAYAVDAALSNRPTEVRFGENTLLTAVVSNSKAPQTVNSVLASGGTIDTRIALPAGCSVTNAGKNVSCSFALATGGSRSFDVAVAAPTSGSSFTSTLTATGVSGGSKSASVITTLSANAQAFVPNGDSLNFQGSNQFTKFNVPVGSTEGGGTFLLLREVTLDNVACGSGTCIRQAAEAIFPGEGKYAGHDINNPFIWDIKYDERQTCNGVGSGSACLIKAYWIPTGGTTTRPVELCPTYGTALPPRLNTIDDPCLVKVDKTTKGYATYTFAVLRDIVIPIVSSVR